MASDERSSHPDSGMPERICDRDRILAIVIPASYREPGIEFFSEAHFSQQLGYMRRPVGYAVDPHVHNPVPREVVYTQEVLFIRRGRVRLDLYRDDTTFVTSRELGAGDVVLLAEGGHGLEVLEECEIVEVKQGPYAGDADKTRFEGCR